MTGSTGLSQLGTYGTLGVPDPANSPGAREGSVSPEGGCPEKFFMSRRWSFAQDKLTINDRENNPLAQLNSASGHFEGQSTAGTPVTLARQPTPAN